MMRALITGIAGFAGSHLADELLSDNTTVVAGIHHPSHPAQHLGTAGRFELFYGDILDPETLYQILSKFSPDVIYHLAGLAHVHESWTYRKATIETNFLGTFHLLEACRKLPEFPKVLLIGSGECYGV